MRRGMQYHNSGSIRMLMLGILVGVILALCL